MNRIIKYPKALLFTSVSALVYARNEFRTRELERVHDNSILYWNIYPGAIVEAHSSFDLKSLLTSNGSAQSAIKPRTQSVYELIKAIKTIQQDDRIRGLIADFSTGNTPPVPAYDLGLAQLEEIQGALIELGRHKRNKFGQSGWTSIALSDTFTNQASYLFATFFDQIHLQPTGQIPLVGLSTTIPFFGNLLHFLGIKVIAEARTEFKSFVQPFISESLTPLQKQNQIELIGDLNNNFMTYLARNRFAFIESESESLNHVLTLANSGPFTARESVEKGLIDSLAYKQDIVDRVFKGTEKKVKDFALYSEVQAKYAKREKGAHRIGIVYLLGTIGAGGADFGAAHAIKGLNEAAEDDEIQSVVLRIDSGGGGVVESDNIWAAVRDVRAKGKLVIASFGNASASGGYLVSTHVDSILCAPSSITGSIGVAALRPTFTQKFYDRFLIKFDYYFTGSRGLDVNHSLDEGERKRYATQIDEMYQDFLERVKEGRGIEEHTLNGLARGRVFSGIRAWGFTAPEGLVKILRGGQSENKVVLIPEGDVSPFAVPIVENIVRGEQPPVERVNKGKRESFIPAAILQDPGTAYPPVFRGKMGRGLIDGIGGVYDSMLYARQLELVKAGLEAKSEREKGEQGIDIPAVSVGPISLKVFPERKPWYSALAGGKNEDPVAPSTLLQLALAGFLTSIARNLIAQEMDSLGINQVKRKLEGRQIRVEFGVDNLKW